MTNNESRPFDHSSESLMGALGMSKGDIVEALKLLASISAENLKKSEIVEKIEKEVDTRALIYLNTVFTKQLNILITHPFLGELNKNVLSSKQEDSF